MPLSQNYRIFLVKKYYGQSAMQSSLNVLHTPVLSGVAQKLPKTKKSANLPLSMDILTHCFMIATS